jgi:N-acetylglutamate synthase-like GNAT family acetyltransferase
MSSGFELPADEVAFRRHRYHQLSTGPKPSMQLFIGRYHGVIAGCAAMVIKEDSAHSTGLYIIPAYRACGVFQSLIAARLGMLRDMGISLVSGHGNEKSAPWIERFGFKSIYSYSIYQLDPPATVG